MKQQKKVILLRPTNKANVPLSLWHSAQNLKMLRVNKNKESGDNTSIKKCKRKGRRRRTIKAKVYARIASNALSPKRKSNVGLTKSKNASSTSVPIAAKSEDSIKTTKVLDLNKEFLGDNAQLEEMPEEWVRCLESHYRKLTDAQNVLALLRKSKQYPIKVKIVKKNKRLKKNAVK
ncbi:uncharacterized protein LOC106670412 [Cimex lectularius]|uniref:Uncharacterized protein n=1 Tax=Cimex lectularius TaxID=79782 RepID=A0A8I6S1B3_CIMLE|nr:uncharacterized protein LOC106670412 [Cimex lectularius]